MAGFAPKMALPLETFRFEDLIREYTTLMLNGPRHMKYAFALFVLSAVSAITVGAAHACNHDIQCPDNWVWSDNEGACVEDAKGTT